MGKEKQIKVVCNEILGYVNNYKNDAWIYVPKLLDSIIQLVEEDKNELIKKFENVKEDSVMKEFNKGVDACIKILDEE